MWAAAKKKKNAKKYFNYKKNISLLIVFRILHVLQTISRSVFIYFNWQVTSNEPMKELSTKHRKIFLNTFNYENKDVKAHIYTPLFYLEKWNYLITRLDTAVARDHCSLIFIYYLNFGTIHTFRTGTMCGKVRRLNFLRRVVLS